MEKMCRLKYQGKWMKVIRITGTYLYRLYENEDEVKPMCYEKALAGRGLVCDDNDLNINEIEIVEV